VLTFERRRCLKREPAATVIGHDWYALRPSLRVEAGGR
jgi:hypothetical protein